MTKLPKPAYWANPFVGNIHGNKNSLDCVKVNSFDIFLKCFEFGLNKISFGKYWHSENDIDISKKKNTKEFFVCFEKFPFICCETKRMITRKFNKFLLFTYDTFSSFLGLSLNLNNTWDATTSFQGKLFEFSRCSIKKFPLNSQRKLKLM
jgi:hypothetical protein